MNQGPREKGSFIGIVPECIDILVSAYSIFRVLPYQTISLILTFLVTECSHWSIKINPNWVPSTMHVTLKFFKGPQSVLGPGPQQT